MDRAVWDYNADERGALHESGKWKLVEKLNTLIGQVTIRSNAEALAFSRLRTSPITNLGYEADELAHAACYYEILPRDAATIGIAFGDRPAYRFLITSKDGFQGIVSRNWFKLNHLFLPKVKKSQKGWEIERVVLRKTSPKHYTPYLLHETVGVHGAYSSRTVRKLDLFPPQGGWTDIDIAL